MFSEGSVVGGKLLIFIHIEKTAGSTLAGALASALGKSNYEWISYDDLINCKDFRRLGRKQMISGHFSYGVHRFFSKRALYVSLIRHPIERIESLYYYQRNTPNDLGHPLAAKYDLNSWIAVLVGSNSNLIRNFQAHRILGVGHRVPNSIFVARSLMRHARRNFIFLDLHYNVSELYNFLGNFFKFKTTPLVCRKVSIRKPMASTLSSSNLSLLTELNRVDFHLFESLKRNPIRSASTTFRLFNRLGFSK